MNRKTMRWAITAVMVYSAVALSSGIQETSERPLVLIGRFAQLRQTPEHVYGYSLELWRDGSSIVGRWSRAEGQQADFPTVLIEQVRWDERDGTFQFTAQWCRETETFNGNLRSHVLSGSVTRRWASGRTESTTVTMPRVESEDLANLSRAQWKTRLEALIRRLGPKC